jgi:hypothetical protein
MPCSVCFALSNPTFGKTFIGPFVVSYPFAFQINKGPMVFMLVKFAVIGPFPRLVSVCHEIQFAHHLVFFGTTFEQSASFFCYYHVYICVRVI